jgi:Icc-related predicted phosphoesterase
VSGQASKIRVAAVADIHAREDSKGAHRELFSDMSARADIVVLGGDLTNRGLPSEAEVLAEELTACRVPVIGVLGNHDYECEQQADVSRILCQAGLLLLDDEPHEVHGVGFAGVKGFCGGFDRHALAPWGETLIKRFVRETVDDALRLESGLGQLRTRHKIVVLHYAPVRETVEGEPPEIFPFLGSSRLSEPIDRIGATAVFHGHAHNGAHTGRTLGGVPVYNVALPIMQRVYPEQPYFVLELDA